MEQIKFVTLSHEELHAIRSDQVAQILRMVGGREQTMTVSVAISDGQEGQTNPHLFVCADIERDGAPHWTAPNPPILLFIEKMGLKDICRGACFRRDELGLAPYWLTDGIEELWDPINDELLCKLSGLNPETTLALRVVEPDKRLAAARELIPDWQQVWKAQFDKAVLAAGLI